MSRDSENSSSTELQVLNPKSDQQGGAVMNPQPYSTVCKKKRLCCLLGTSFATVLTLLMVTLFVRTFILKEVFVRTPIAIALKISEKSLFEQNSLLNQSKKQKLEIVNQDLDTVGNEGTVLFALDLLRQKCIEPLQLEWSI